MPTYEYRCENGHEFEVFQRMSEPPVEKCAQCGAKAERLLSAGVGLVFKGSGFYITDYRSDSYKKDAAADKGSAGASGSADAKTEPKAAPSSEAKPSPKSSDSGKAGPAAPSSSSGSE